MLSAVGQSQKRQKLYDSTHMSYLVKFMHRKSRKVGAGGCGDKGMGSQCLGGAEFAR